MSAKPSIEKKSATGKAAPEQTTQLQESTLETSASNPSGDKLNTTTNKKDLAKDVKASADAAVKDVKDALPSKKDVKDAAKQVQDSLPSKKELNDAATDAVKQVKDSLPSKKELNDAATDAVKQVKDALPSKKELNDAAKQVKQTAKDIKDSLPTVEQVKDAASKLQKDATVKLQEAEVEIRQGLIPSLKQNVRSLRASALPWLQRQSAMSKNMFTEIMNQPPAAKFLLLSLIFTNVVLPLFALNRQEGIITLLTYFATSMFASYIYSATPATSPNRLLISTFSHVLFVPLMVYLAARLGGHETHTSSVSMEHVDVWVTLFMKKGWFLRTMIPAILTVNAIVLINDAMQLYRVISKITAGKTPKSLEDAKKIGDALIGDDSQTIQASEQHAEGIKQRLRSHAAPTA